ncbi:MAG: hypothetical protein KAR20_05890, partial [Candidatus Heimdallarchaeota archaeon]|nr:hypothetical protein [Candidatus Heimdallarchaeota archaeon]
AAENRVEMAEDLAGGTDISEIVYPNASSNNAELAWHFFLPSLTSGYMYYGTALDMEVKQTIACNKAMEFADAEIFTHQGVDNTAPSVFIPQRFPYNPGGKGFGPIYSYQEHNNSSDFFVWTFAYDASEIQTINLKFRIDNDGINTLSDNDNEVYSGGAGVGNWQSIPMTERIFPTGNVTGNPEIDFFVLPTYIANEYYAEITGITESLVDYYIEATDTFGNTKKTPIQHVYVGEETSNPGSYVSWQPIEPEVGDTLEIFYGELGSLYNSPQLQIHLGFNGWQDVNDLNMNFNAAENRWEYSFVIAENVEIVDFVFTDGSGNWDNNNGQDWHVSVSGGTSTQFVMDGEIDENAELLLSEGDLYLYAGYNGSEIYVATPPANELQKDVFILVSEEPISLVTAPWNKAGQVGNWDLYLAQESTSGWSGWFDNNGSTQSISGTVLEGVFLFSSEIGRTDEIYLALGVYETEDTGELTNQLPVGNADTNIDFDEFYYYTFDFLESPQNISISYLNDQVTLNWDAVSGADNYVIYASDSPDSGFEEIATITVTTFSAPIVGNDKKFYRVVAVSE